MPQKSLFRLGRAFLVDTVLTTFYNGMGKQCDVFAEIAARQWEIGNGKWEIELLAAACNYGAAASISISHLAFPI